MVPTYPNSLCGLTMEVSTFWFLTLKGHPPKRCAACVISIGKRQSCISRTQTELPRMSAGYKLSLCVTIFIYFIPNSLSLSLSLSVSVSLSLLTLPLPDHISNSPLCQPYNSYDVYSENCVGSTNNPLVDIFHYPHHFSACYCIDIVRRKSVLVTHGN